LLFTFPKIKQGENMLRVALCDFNHETVGIHAETMPLAIGLIGSYAMEKHKGQLEVRLYKLVEDFNADISEGWFPEVLGLSCYSWNSNLNLHIARHVRNINPETVCIMGGPDIPLPEKTMDVFFKNNPFIDFVVNKDGEIPFSKIIGRILQKKKIEDIGREGIPGVHFYSHASKSSFHFGMGEKIQSLDEVPSPYLNGMMDKFFTNSKYNFAPFIESNRGCPYACTFCHSAGKYYSKLQWAGLERLEKELIMFGKHFSGQHEIRLFLADNNFGMFDLDFELASILRNIQDKYDWPRYIDTTMGKARPDHIMKVNAKLKWGLNTTASVQTLTESVLKTIERKNLKFDDYIMLSQETSKLGKGTSSEIILGLPGETKESFLETISKLIQSDINEIIPYTLMNLRGTPLYDYHMEKKSEHIFKRRIVPRQFGDYFSEKVFDTEEVIVGTPSLSYDDYLYCRGFSFIIKICYNGAIFPELLKLMKEYNVDIFRWLISVFQKLQVGSCKASLQLKDFMCETEEELWESEEKLINHYKLEKNYKKLLTGKVGNNLLGKYCALALSEGFPDWLNMASQSAEEKIFEHCLNGDRQQVKDMIRDIRLYSETTKNVYPMLFDTSAIDKYNQKYISLKYDIPSWQKTPNEKLVMHQENLNYSIYFDDMQIKNFRRISMLEINEKDVKIAFILNGYSSDYWAKAKPTESCLA
jgi:radical SAM superfamily enzyme YgiQ (UPF0313 family)